MKAGAVAVAAMMFGLGAFGTAGAADVAAGKAKATPCTACHGQNGISVAPNIPNLAGQKAKYLEIQLNAFRAGTRKNAMMNPIAKQLKDGDIANLAAFFSGLRGATGTAKSDPLAAFTATKVGFPAGYKKSFTLYTTISFPKRKQVRRYYANPVALKAARDGQRMPNGAYFLVEVYKAKLDGQKKPVKGSDGHFVAGKLVAMTAMAKDAGWGDAIPAILRNGDWNYAVFTAAGKLRKVNTATCFACHKPLQKVSYVFSLEALQATARGK